MRARACCCSSSRERCATCWVARGVCPDRMTVTLWTWVGNCANPLRIEVNRGFGGITGKSANAQLRPFESQIRTCGAGRRSILICSKQAPGLWLDSLSERPSEWHQHNHLRQSGSVSDKQMGLRSRVEHADSGEVTWHVGLGGGDRRVGNTGWPRHAGNNDPCSLHSPPPAPSPPLDSREHAEGRHARGSMKVRPPLLQPNRLVQ